MRALSPFAQVRECPELMREGALVVVDTQWIARLAALPVEDPAAESCPLTLVVLSCGLLQHSVVETGFPWSTHPTNYAVNLLTLRYIGCKRIASPSLSWWTMKGLLGDMESLMKLV